MIRNRYPFRKIVTQSLAFFVVIFILSAVLWSSVSLQHVFDQTVSVLADYILMGGAMSGFLFVSLAAVSTVLSFFSSVPLVPIAVAAWGEWTTAIFLLMGWMIGSIVSYLIGCIAGKSLINKLFQPHKVEEYQRFVTRHSNFGVVLLFRLALPAEIPGFVLGIMKYNFFKYLAATLISELPVAIIAVYSSHALIQKQMPQFIWAVGVGLVFITGTVILLRTKLNQARKKQAKK